MVSVFIGLGSGWSGAGVGTAEEDEGCDDDDTDDGDGAESAGDFSSLNNFQTIRNKELQTNTYTFRS